jgi:hypothetical protein
VLCLEEDQVRFHIRGVLRFSSEVPLRELLNQRLRNAKMNINSLEMSDEIGSQIKEVRGFEPRTPCMPSARDPFMRVHIRPNRLRFLDFQFASVHQNSPEFISTAEVTAEVNPLRAVQGVGWNHGTTMKIC